MPKFRNRRFRRFRKKNNRKPKMSFDKRVLEVFNKSRELKVMKPSSIVTNVDNAIQFNTDLVRLLSDCPQGVNEYERTGNQINLQMIKVRAYYMMELPINDSINDCRALIRHMILKQKNTNGAELVIDGSTPFLVNTLLENASAYNGSISNYMTPVNKAAFVLRKQMKKQLVCGATNTAGQQEMVTNKSFWMVDYTLTFGKGKILTYRNSGATQPTNFPYFLAHAASPMGSASWSTPASPVDYYQTTTCYFYDS